MEKNISSRKLPTNTPGSSSDTLVSTGTIAFGSTWPRRIAGSESPLARAEDIGDLLAGHPALAEVEGCDLAQEDAELHVPRPVEAELAADGVDLLGARHLAGEDLRRIAAEELEEEEHQQDDTRQRGHH